MKNWLVGFLLLISFLLCGCIEPYSTGVLTGAVGREAILNKAEDNFLTAIITMNEEAARINDIVSSVEGMILLRPETIKAIEGIKEREKDPLTWVAFASIMTNAVLFGKRDIKKKES